MFLFAKLQKLARNFCERYRYGAPRLVLRQNSKKIASQSWSLFLLPLPRNPNDCANSRIL
ncbi:hypothetical protein [Campylobacter magnus]|uniref:Uncharacterized protein n=1 Tax=Campylobacter magnus TaxID=3026462 RepID=A0ABT8T902_9BACT|nr:hypothetical protein [Campylobacter magnus]MDO2409478.1 hypothetical protein [Campylobacter magnus]